MEEGDHFIEDRGRQSPPGGRLDSGRGTPAVPQAASASSSKHTQESLRILYIEDDPIAVRLMREYILQGTERFGLSFETAASVADGLERLAAIQPDVLLLDLSLPDSQGVDTVARVRARHQAIPIVVLTGDDDETVAFEALKAGAQDYLVKGQIDAQILVRVIRYGIKRKLAEEELARERDLLRGLLNHIPDRIYFKDSASRFVRINQSMADRFHLPAPEAAVGKTDFDFHPAVTAEEFFADEQRMLESGKPIINKIERQTDEHGREVWASVTKVVMRDRQGHPTGLIGISRDISHLVRAEAALEKERTLLRNLVDHLPDYIYAVDGEGRFTMANEAFQELADRAVAQSLLGKTALELFAAPLGAEVHEAIAQVLRTGLAVINREEPCRLTKQEDCWLATTMIPLRNSDAHVVGLVAISHDITERRRARRELQSSNDELRSANTALRDLQLQVMHAERLQSIGRMAAGVAHEVKNPLAVLRMGVDFFLGAEATPELRSASGMVLEEMQSAITRADTIIMGMLNFSTPGEIQVKPVEVDGLLDHALTLVRHELNAHNYVVDRQPALRPAFALLDTQKIDQVLVNLLTNAFHAMPAGGRLTLRTVLHTLGTEEVGHDAGSRAGAQFRTGDDLIRIEIDDTGCGIPPDKVDKIFEPFFTTKETGKGTGLGLTVARKIVELHGGTLTLQNRPEGGVRSTLCFKATKERP